MNYYNDNIQRIQGYTKTPSNFDKNTSKEILQYCIGSLLYMPATHTEIVGKIVNKAYPYLKSMVLDLEDSVGEELADKAEKDAVSTVKSLYDFSVIKGKLSINNIPLVFIRVKNPEQLKRIVGLLGESVSVLTGFVLPKFDKENCDKYIDTFMSIKSHHQLYIMPILESKNIMYKQLRLDNLLYLYDKLNTINEYVLNIRCGIADFCNIFGIRRNIENTVWDIKPIADCLSDIINVFGRNYVISSGVWKWFGGTNSHHKWEVGLITEVQADLTNGLFGKTAIHPTQLEVIQSELVVPDSDYKDALSIISNSDSINAVTRGTGNKMNEIKTQLKWARKTLTIADVYGVVKD